MKKIAGKTAKWVLCVEEKIVKECETYQEARKRMIEYEAAGRPCYIEPK